jgi:hypothetical protein
MGSNLDGTSPGEHSTDAIEKSIPKEWQPPVEYFDLALKYSEDALTPNERDDLTRIFLDGFKILESIVVAKQRRLTEMEYTYLILFRECIALEQVATADGKETYIETPQELPDGYAISADLAERLSSYTANPGSLSKRERTTIRNLIEYEIQMIDAISRKRPLTKSEARLYSLFNRVLNEYMIGKNSTRFLSVAEKILRLGQPRNSSREKRGKSNTEVAA